MVVAVVVRQLSPAFSLEMHVAGYQLFVDMNILKPETDGQRTDAYLPLIGTL